MPKFSQALFNTICERMSDGESLRTICTDKDMPARSTVHKWLADDDKRTGNKRLFLSDQYARAQSERADKLFDECLEIADEAANDITAKEDGTQVVNHENIQRARLRVDTRKWMIGKMQPRKYGDRTQMELTGAEGEAIKTEIQVNIIDPKQPQA